MENFMCVYFLITYVLIFVLVLHYFGVSCSRFSKAIDFIHVDSFEDT